MVEGLRLAALGGCVVEGLRLAATWEGVWWKEGRMKQEVQQLQVVRDSNLGGCGLRLAATWEGVWWKVSG